MATAHSLSSLSFQIGTWIAPEGLGASGSLRGESENAYVEGYLAQLTARSVSAGQPCFPGQSFASCGFTSSQEDPAHNGSVGHLTSSDTADGRHSLSQEGVAFHQESDLR